MEVGLIDFVGNIGKGNDSKLKGKVIIVKGFFYVVEVYGVLVIIRILWGFSCLV